MQVITACIIINHFYIASQILTIIKQHMRLPTVPYPKNQTIWQQFNLHQPPIITSVTKSPYSRQTTEGSVQQGLHSGHCRSDEALFVGRSYLLICVCCNDLAKPSIPGNK